MSEWNSEEAVRLVDDPELLLALKKQPPSNKAVAEQLRRFSAATLFGGCYSPEGAMAGLWLVLSGWKESHEIAQSMRSAEGSYWHALVHRAEPDEDNAKYWFRQLGTHEIFSELAEKARPLAANRHFAGFSVGDVWSPEAFLRFCTEASRKPDSEADWLAREIHTLECRLLFHYCCRRLA